MVMGYHVSMSVESNASLSVFTHKVIYTLKPLSILGFGHNECIQHIWINNYYIMSSCNRIIGQFMILHSGFYVWLSSIISKTLHSLNIHYGSCILSSLMAGYALSQNSSRKLHFQESMPKLHYLSIQCRSFIISVLNAKASFSQY